MAGLPIIFYFTDDNGRETRMSLEAVQKLWVDHDRFGLIYTETDPTGKSIIREATVNNTEAAEGMAKMIDDLIAVPKFEFLEEPIAPDRERLVLEFRHPHPQTVNLSWRTD